MGDITGDFREPKPPNRDELVALRKKLSAAENNHTMLGSANTCGTTDEEIVDRELAYSRSENDLRAARKRYYEALASAAVKPSQQV